MLTIRAFKKNLLYIVRMGGLRVTDLGNFIVVRKRSSGFGPADSELITHRV